MTKYQIFTILPQISHFHKYRNFSSIFATFWTNCFIPINFMAGTCEEYSFEPWRISPGLLKCLLLPPYVMWSSKMGWNSQILFLRYSQTKPMVSFVSYCLFNPSTVCIFGTNCPISVGFQPNESLNNTLIENGEKTQNIFFEFRLILLDCITNQSMKRHAQQFCIGSKSEICNHNNL